jgi:hypothetical protein
LESGEEVLILVEVHLTSRNGGLDRMVFRMRGIRKDLLIDIEFKLL